ncbi:MAG TPA: hydrogenase maturation protease, partial [Gemmatimonadaceae bacterium]|nr:hydrogenase maturation protease [Gemmatimonadaceae bacterium]
DVHGVTLARGCRVRLVPQPGKDLFDTVLAGKTAIIEGIDQDQEGRIHVAVILDDDPGRDLGAARQPGHRFFFALDEIEPVEGAAAPAPPHGRVLVAGIGNIFFGDDGFGVEVARALAARALPPQVDVVDFGIRGMDLAYALQDEYAAAILVDAAPRGEPPGTLSIIEVDAAAEPEVSAIPDAHGMDPVRVLRLARQMGRIPQRIVIVACEPARLTGDGGDEDLIMELSDPARRALSDAVRLVERLIDDLGGRPGLAASPLRSHGDGESGQRG